MNTQVRSSTTIDAEGDSSFSCHPGPSLSDIERQLAAEEEEAVRTGKKLPVHDVTSGEFLSIGLDLEDQQ